MARPEGGYYRDGVRIVSVTEALTQTRIRRWSGSQASWAWRALIGSAVHKATAILDVNRETWDSAPRDWMVEFDAVDPEVKAMVKAWEAFKREEEFVPRLIEHSFITKTGITEFGTTIDREGLLKGIPAIVEIKTPRVAEPYWGVQMAGQELAVIAAQGPPRERPYKYARRVCQLFKTEKYKVIPYEDPKDRDVFLWSLGIAVWNRINYGE